MCVVFISEQLIGCYIRLDVLLVFISLINMRFKLIIDHFLKLYFVFVHFHFQSKF